MSDIKRRKDAVTLLALLLIAAPLTHLVVLVISSGFSDWWRPAIMTGIFKQIPATQWLTFAIMFISGPLLLIRHKATWAASVIGLAILIIINIVQGLTSLEGTDGADYELLWLRLIFSVFLGAIALMILALARYPYLDRRHGWLSQTARRTDVKLPVLVHGQKVLPGLLESISLSGCRIQLENASALSPAPSHLDIEITSWDQCRIRCEVVSIESSIVRLKFAEFLSEDRARFIQRVEAVQD